MRGITRKSLLFLSWIAITVCIQLFGSAIMEYVQFIIGLTTMKKLSGGAGIVVVVLLLGGALHFITHWLTMYRQ